MKYRATITEDQTSIVLADFSEQLEWYKTQDFLDLVQDKCLSFHGIFTYFGEELMDLCEKHNVNPYHAMAYAILRHAKQSSRTEDHDIIARGIFKFIEDYLDKYKYVDINT